MPFSFPSSPTVGQTSAQANGRTYVWDGYSWGLVSNVSGHAATHTLGGADQISVDGTQVTSGTVADARLSTRTQAALNLFLWTNYR